MTDSTDRFTGRVENYARYRPTYPRAVLDLLETECGLTDTSVIADIGSGTGILSELFLDNANRLYAVEPNEEMREAAEGRFGERANFTSVAGAAEATTLDEESVDFVVAGQAFHWFDVERARAEFGRILRPGGWVVLIWNARRGGTTPFLGAYERLLRAYRTDSDGVEVWMRNDALSDSFFSPSPYETATFDNYQLLDLDGLKGRLLSTSYLPAEGEPSAGDMLREAEEIFHQHESDGEVAVEYDTKVFYGHPPPVSRPEDEGAA
ncbi:MAG TPA: class I SAM-dependent methyltransferase [Rubrobacteraceae bacterium]|nr:class I SAM-dependent methyltransferase [Rubrobacteraceae bacterium]